MEEEVANSYLTFVVNGNVYGVQVAKVVEILAYQQPQAKTSGLDYMLGLVEHRGGVVPLIDSGRKFGSEPIRLTEQTYVIVINANNNGAEFQVALAVDAVREVIIVPVEERKPITTAYKPGYVEFAAPTPDGLAIFFNPDLVFSDTDVVELSKLAAQE